MNCSGCGAGEQTNVEFDSVAKGVSAIEVSHMVHSAVENGRFHCTLSAGSDSGGGLAMVLARCLRQITLLRMRDLRRVRIFGDQKD